MGNPVLIKLIYQEQNKKAIADAKAALAQMTEEEKKAAVAAHELATAQDAAAKKAAAHDEKVKKAAASTKHFGESQVQASQKTSILQDANSKLNDTLKSGATMLLAAFPAALLAAGAASVKLGMDMEQTRVAFTTLTGSVEKANQHLDELRDFAKSTPFQFTELTDASKKMMAFGFATADVVPMMTDIGDAVSALGAGSQGIDSVVRALGQMQAKGKVSAEEMNQLTEVGISGWKYLAQGIGVTTGEVMKMSERGLIPAGDAIQYILDGMREDFGGGMAAQSKTAAGQLSNLTDSLEEMGSTLGEIAVPAVSAIIGKLNEFFTTLKNGVTVFKTIESSQNMVLKAFKETEEQLRKSATSYEDYKNGIMGIAEVAQFTSDTTENGLIPQVTMFTEEMWNAEHGIGNFTAGMLREEEVLRSNMAALYGNAEAAAAAAAALEPMSAILSPTELGMRALAEASNVGGRAQEDFAKWVEVGKKAQEDAHAAIAKSAESYIALGASLKGATEAELAQQAIANLGVSLESGLITTSQYSEAVRGIQLEYGFATEQSIATGEALLILNGAYSDGTITSEQYKEALSLVDTVAKDGKVSLNEFGLEVNFTDEATQKANPRLQEMGVTHLPKVKESADQAKSKLDLMKTSTDNSAEAMNTAATRAAHFRDQLRLLAEQINKMPAYEPGAGGSASGGQRGSIPGAATGANFIVPSGYPNDQYRIGVSSGERVIVQTQAQQRTNYFNMTVNARNAPNVIDEFNLMQAMAGV